MLALTFVERWHVIEAGQAAGGAAVLAGSSALVRGRWSSRATSIGVVLALGWGLVLGAWFVGARPGVWWGLALMAASALVTTTTPPPNVVSRLTVFVVLVALGSLWMAIPDTEPPLTVAAALLAALAVSGVARRLPDCWRCLGTRPFMLVAVVWWVGIAGSAGHRRAVAVTAALTALCAATVWALRRMRGVGRLIVVGADVVTSVVIARYFGRLGGSDALTVAVGLGVSGLIIAARLTLRGSADDQ